MRGPLALALTFLGLALLAAVLAAFLVAGGAFEGMGSIWGWVAGGALVVGLLTAGLMRLAFYSSSRGYDDVDRRP